MLTRVVLQRVAVIWVICLVILSLQPNRAPGTRGRVLPHQIEHVVVFGATAVILLALGRNRKQEWLAIAGVATLAVGIELAQWLIYQYRDFEWWDVREDMIGALFGMLLIRYSQIRSAILLTSET